MGKFFLSRDFWIGLGLLIIFFSHYIIMGQDSVWYAQDYTELVIPWYKLLIDNNGLWKSNDYTIPGMLDYLPRASFASAFFLKTWLFFFFEPFQAVLLNKLLIHVLAYCSGYHLLDHFLQKKPDSRIALFSLMWASIPFWPEAGIGLAFLPTVFLIFYRISQGEKFKLVHGFLIFFYCFYSILHLNGVFVIVFLSIGGLYHLLKEKKINFPFWGALAGLCLCYAVFSYRLLLVYFFQRNWFIPHRVEYDIYSFVRYHDDIPAKVAEILFFGNTHAAFIAPFFYLIIAGFLIGSTFLRNKSNVFRPILWLFLGVNAIALLAALVTYIPLVERVPLLLNMKEFSFERFYFLIYPVMIFASSFILNDMFSLPRLKFLAWTLVLTILGYQLLVLDNNAKNYVLKPLLGVGEKYPTYREFYAVDQFKLIKSFLDEKSPSGYKLASLGFHPAITSYNNLNAIDGYTGNYSLAYKDEFFEIIKDELGEDDRENWLYWHFKGWGNKAYLFNQIHKDDFMRMKWLETQIIDHPKYNYEKMKEMGCLYMLSTDPVVDEDNLDFMKKFEHPASAWDIHVYKIK